MREREREREIERERERERERKERWFPRTNRSRNKVINDYDG